MISKAEASERVLAAKEARGLTFKRLAEHIGRDPVWTTAALMGQMQMDGAEADAIIELLGLDDEVAAALRRHPSKGTLGTTVPTDPLMYRFYEVLQVYGTTIKALIEEEFGDGIMSAIDFELKVQRKPDPKGDRVLVTMDGKFLPYRKW